MIDKKPQKFTTSKERSPDIRGDIQKEDKRLIMLTEMKRLNE